MTSGELCKRLRGVGGMAPPEESYLGELMRQAADRISHLEGALQSIATDAKDFAGADSTLAWENGLWALHQYARAALKETP